MLYRRVAVSCWKEVTSCRRILRLSASCWRLIAYSNGQTAPRRLGTVTPWDPKFPKSPVHHVATTAQQRRGLWSRSSVAQLTLLSWPTGQAKDLRLTSADVQQNGGPSLM